MLRLMSGPYVPKVVEPSTSEFEAGRKPAPLAAPQLHPSPRHYQEKA
jgi:hypothetical protein